MELEFRILNLYKTRQYNECLKLSETTLHGNNERLLEFLRMRAITIQAKLAGYGYEEVDYYLQKNELSASAVAQTTRPGTSFIRNKTSKIAKTADFTRKTSICSALRSSGLSAAGPRKTRTTLYTASRMSRAVTALNSGSNFSQNVTMSLRFLDKDDKVFLPAAKTLFEYVYYCEGDVRKAIDILCQAQIEEPSDWWWNFSLARCYIALGMYRKTEDCLRLALKQNKHIAIYLRLIAMYVGINQPLSALEVCKQGLAVFHNYTPLLIEQARIHDEMGNTNMAVKEYRAVAIEDPSNMEAVACIATYNFYNDQPEIALRYYRRLLATNAACPEIYNNLGLCCLYCNQWDLTITCFLQALYLCTSPDIRSNIWFNLAHVALSTGDMTLARRCLQVSLAITSNNATARSALLTLDLRLGSRNILTK